MDTHFDCHPRRLPTLVQLCQRAAFSQVDSITSLGDDLPYSLVKPILERCSVEQLLRFENLSPVSPVTLDIPNSTYCPAQQHLQSGTPELWRDWCFRKHRLLAQQRYSFDDDPQEPDSWRSRFFILEDAEAKRFDELGSKLRTQRMEANERKKEKEVKYTDRLHSDKRPRMGVNCYTSTQPKTLFQKVKSDASKLHRAYFNTRVLPPMPTAKNCRILPQSCGACLPPVSSSSTKNRVVVNTVIHRRPINTTGKTLSSTSSLSRIPRISMSTSALPSPRPSPTAIPNEHSVSKTPKKPSIPNPPPRPNAESPRPSVKISPTIKKDPMASLFVPKRKVLPQRST